MSCYFVSTVFSKYVERCAAPRRWLWHIATHNALLNRLSHSILKFFTHPPRPGGIARHRFADVFLSHASNASLTHCILPSNLCGKKESCSHCSAFFQQSSLENRAVAKTCEHIFQEFGKYGRFKTKNNTWPRKCLEKIFALVNQKTRLFSKVTIDHESILPAF